MSTVSMSAIISGTCASRAALLSALFSIVPPVSSRVPAGIDARRSSSAPAICSCTKLGSRPGSGSRLNGDRGQTAAAPDVAFVEVVLEPRELAQGHGGAASAS